MAAQKVGAWAPYGNMLQRAAEKTESTLIRAVDRQAAILVSDIKRNITTGGSFAGKKFAALSPVTIDLKGSSAPLIDKGDMRNAVQRVKLGKFDRLVGIPGTLNPSSPKKGEPSTTIAQYARKHEFGAIEKDGTVIKKRSFIGPVIDKTKKERTEALRKEMMELFEV